MDNLLQRLTMLVLICILAISTCLASPPFSPVSATVLPTAHTNSTTPLEKECADAVNNTSEPNDKCDACVNAAGGKCFFCYTDNKCRPFFSTNIFHTPKECDYSKARIWTCAINLQVMAISLISIFGVLMLLLISCCCYCCCCRQSGGTTRWKKELRRLEEKEKKRKEQAEERKKEREIRYNDIRKKYGLNDSKPGYKRMN